jgi:hypothetical protein
VKYQVLSSIVAGAMTLSFSTDTHDYKWPYHPRPHKDYTVPTVFQAAGPDIASIQGTVDQFRAALGGVNNGNVAGPLDAGLREINWDGGGPTATSPAPTPFSGFLVTRGALFTTPGTGFVQAPLDGLVTTFNNPDYANIFQPFSPVRVFVPREQQPDDGRVLRARRPGDIPAVSSGFDAIFSDVDEPDGRPQRYGSKDASTYLRFYDAYGELLYISAVAPSPGDASLSFLGVLFDNPKIAKIKIVTGEVPLGPYDERRQDVVVMDDFIFGEPRLVK